MAAGDIVVGMDISSTKVCTVVGELNNSGEIEIMGYGVQKSVGVKKSMIVDIEMTIKAIEESIIDAEEMTDVDIDSVYVNIGGSNIESFNSKGTIAITDSNREINDEDTDRVIEAARAVNIPPNREIIHVIPLTYCVDNQPEIKVPIGMTGTKLQVETHIITNITTTLKNVVKTVKNAGLSVDRVILQSLASSEAVLTSDEKELGVVMVDIGAGTTDIAIFTNGHVQYSSILSIGSDNITNDIAVCEVIPHGGAEELKLKYGTLNSESVDEDETIEVETASRDTKKQVSKYELHEIISARMEEIIKMVKNEIESSGLRPFIPSGIVITGGGAKMDGLVDFAAHIFEKPVRIGKPFDVQSLNDNTSSPIFSTAIGLMTYGLKLEQLKQGGFKDRGGLIKQLAYWIRDWFSDLF